MIGDLARLMAVDRLFHKDALQNRSETFMGVGGHRGRPLLWFTLIPSSTKGWRVCADTVGRSLFTRCPGAETLAEECR